VAAIDTSGAGDVFAGVLAAGLDRGFGLAEAVSRANHAAAIATTRRGALASCPTRDELSRMMIAPKESK
jgi:ribokinase